MGGQEAQMDIQYYPYIKVFKGPAKFVYYIEGLLYWRFISINNSSIYDVQVHNTVNVKDEIKKLGGQIL